MLLAAALPLVGACSPAPEASGEASTQRFEETQRIEGMLVLKGNLPHRVPVLQSDSGNWELVGVDTEQLRPLLRQRVIVTGTVLPSAPPQRPRLQTESIEAVR
jgi:hypothetical protein